jgi:hypothetical protein
MEVEQGKEMQPQQILFKCFFFGHLIVFIRLLKLSQSKKIDVKIAIIKTKAKVAPCLLSIFIVVFTTFH